MSRPPASRRCGGAPARAASSERPGAGTQCTCLARSCGGGGRDGGGTPAQRDGGGERWWVRPPNGESATSASGTRWQAARRARRGQHGREVVRYSRAASARALSRTHATWLKKLILCMCQWRVRDDGARYISSERNYAHARERECICRVSARSHSQHRARPQHALSILSLTPHRECPLESRQSDTL